MLNKVFKYLTVVLLGVFFVTACKDNAAELSSDEPPQIPPAESMEMDFSTYENNQSQGNNIAAKNGTNFAQAAVRAIIMKAVVDVNLFIPRVLLEAASNNEAEFNDEGEWVWTYSKMADGETYEVRLIATRESDNEVNWQFFVTNSALNIDDKLFFSGTSNDDGTNGSWTYFNLQNSEEQEAVSEINWSVENEEDISLRLEVVSDRNNNLGDFIEYTFDGTVKNAIYFNAGENETTELEWNTETNAGFIIAPNYNNGTQACWDENFENTSCS